MADGSAPRCTGRLRAGLGPIPILLGVLMLVLVLDSVGAGGVASAHEGIAGSDPASGTHLDEPIDQVTIDFGTRIGDDAEIAVFEPGGEQLASQLETVSDTEARATFDPIEQHGTYTVRYLATSIDDGDLLAGAISFSYGSTSSGPSTTAWIVFGSIVVVILALGVVFTLRLRRAARRRFGLDPPPAGSPDGSDIDEDLSDVGV
jgi:methionine-rich copper-binding protein CopC